ncbi:MAG: ABC transporter permease [Alphaproteobacteria bacterium]|jgi:peptide/nickel transport system permease protein|nr:ABC transporter permease [Alphaproteobacteria bacterium]MDP6567572.1 ABC transporter permease [Alphaproteobacteria bacterium]MDP6815430.1 ABC transporter permease [Alphaproteobacteria bacterium]
MSEQQLRARQRVDTVSADDSVWEIRLRRLRAVTKNALQELYKSKTATVGAMMIVLLLAMVVLTPVLATHHPTKPNYRVRLQPVSVEHYFGTDKFGRDIYSRVLYGGQRTVLISIAAVVLGLSLGIPLGVFSGFFGGRFDAISMRFVDGLIAFPGLLLYLLIITLAREWKLEGFYNDLILVFALGVNTMPEVARLARGSALQEAKKEYVEAAHIIGEGSAFTAMREILPNCISPLIVNATVRLGYVILIVAALSFLGLGTPPPTPDWGADLSVARDHMETHPMIAVFPGLAICYSVLAFNLFGDGLRDILDPRLSER